VVECKARGRIMIGRAEQHIGPAHPAAGLARRAQSEPEAPPASYRFHSPHQLTPCSPQPCRAHSRTSSSRVYEPEPWAALWRRLAPSRVQFSRTDQAGLCVTCAAGAAPFLSLPSPAAAASGAHLVLLQFAQLRLIRTQHAAAACRGLCPSVGKAARCAARAAAAAGDADGRRAFLGDARGARMQRARHARGARATLLRSKGLPALLSRRAVCSSSAAQPRCSAAGQGEHEDAHGQGARSDAGRNGSGQQGPASSASCTHAARSDARRLRAGASRRRIPSPAALQHLVNGGRSTRSCSLLTRPALRRP
jgi:hypothetical protein